MLQFKYTCDQCKSSEISTIISTNQAPKGWEVLDIKVARYQSIRRHLCPDCAKKAGLATPERPEKEQDLADKILGLFHDLVLNEVAEALENQ